MLKKHKKNRHISVIGRFHVDNIDIFRMFVLPNDFETTLSTVKSGDFKKYSVEFTRALSALHNAFPNLTDNGHNPPDLTKIMEESANAGRTMKCTPQGDSKNNLFYDFTIVDSNGKIHEIQKLNCEYHLKLNFDNQGEKIPKGAKMNNRAYFGLPLIDGIKYIALAHLGGHL